MTMMIMIMIMIMMVNWDKKVYSYDGDDHDDHDDHDVDPFQAT